MSCGKITVNDEIVGAMLMEISSVLDISVGDLIDRYVRRELFTDDCYEPPEYTFGNYMKWEEKQLRRIKDEASLQRNIILMRLLGF